MCGSDGESWESLFGDGEHVGCEIEAIQAKPRGGEAVGGVSGPCFCDGRLVCLGGRGGEGERYLGEAELEQPVAAARLAVVVAFRRRAAEGFDLPVVQAEAPVNRLDLRFERAVIGQEQSRGTAFNNGR